VRLNENFGDPSWKQTGFPVKREWTLKSIAESISGQSVCSTTTPPVWAVSANETKRKRKRIPYRGKRISGPGESVTNGGPKPFRSLIGERASARNGLGARPLRWLADVGGLSPAAVRATADERITTTTTTTTVYVRVRVVVRRGNKRMEDRVCEHGYGTRVTTKRRRGENNVETGFPATESGRLCRARTHARAHRAAGGDTTVRGVTRLL